MVNLSVEQEQEAQELVSKIKGGDFAKYSTYASSKEVRDRMQYLWTHGGGGGYSLTVYKPSAREIEVQEKYGVYTPTKIGELGIIKGTIKEVASAKKINVPIGYSAREVVDIHSKYQSQLTPEQRRLSQYEQNKIITSNPEYQREITSVYKQPGQPEKMQTYAKEFGFKGDISQYGKEQYVLPSGKILPITPENTQKVIESRQEQYLTRKLVSTFNYKGKKVPVYKTYLNYRDAETGELKKREATDEEREYYRQQTNYLQASQEKAPSQFVQITGGAILPELKGMWEESGISNLLSTEIRLPSFIIPGASITVSEFKEYVKEFGLGGQILGSIPFPETYGQAVVLGASALTFPVLPKVIQIAVGGFTSVTGIAGAFNQKATTGERIVSGTIGTLAGIGTVFEAMPYIKGGLARLSPSYAAVKVQPEGFKAIQLEGTRIGLIPEKSPLKTGLTYNVELPSTSPLKRGGFEVSPSQKSLFLGKEQYLTTSQISLFKKGVSIPIEREFFTTPQEPFIGIPETRISRLGLSDLFKFNKNVEIGFGIPKTPQIGLTIADVGRVETARGFAIGKGTELEAIKTFGTITDVTKIGVTSIRGQYVQLYKYNIGEGIGTAKAISTKGISSIVSPRVSGEVTITTALSFKTPQITTKITTTPVTFRTTQAMPTYVTSKTYKPSISISPYKTTTTSYKPSVSKPVLKIALPSITTGTTKKVARTSYLTTPLKKSTYYPTPSRKSFQVSKQFKGNKISSGKLFKQPSGGFSVYVRRGGKFSLLGAGLSLPKAFSLGTGKVRRTLAATFLVKQQRGTYRGKTPLGFYAKPTKMGILYIEKRSQRIKKKGVSLELPELKYYKSMKGGRR